MNEMTNQRSVAELCVSYCMQCVRTCQETKAYCLTSGKNSNKLVFILDDCAKICSLTGDLIINHSPLMISQAGICVKICDRASEECNKFDDDVLKNCADFCSSCSDSCRGLVGI